MPHTHMERDTLSSKRVTTLVMPVRPHRKVSSAGITQQKVHSAGITLVGLYWIVNLHKGNYVGRAPPGQFKDLSRSFSWDHRISLPTSPWYVQQLFELVPRTCR